jgi:2-C-methyl-D-erythritol 4-phosphate cytidylyltransferase
VTDDPNAPGRQRIAAIILAAGSSARMGGIDKIWAPLDGAPVLAHSLRAFAAVRTAEGAPAITDLVLVAPEDRHPALLDLATGLGLTVHTVEGGTRRQDSVARGLAAAPDADWYLVHDGARPLVTPDLIARVLAGAREHGAAVPGILVHDAIKRVDRTGRVITSVDRSMLRAVQTPQGFAGHLLRRAHATVRASVSDDAAMVEALGAPVQTVEGDPENLKITTTHDLDIARHLLSRRRAEDAE